MSGQASTKYGAVVGYALHKGGELACSTGDIVWHDTVKEAQAERARPLSFWHDAQIVEIREVIVE